jgi:hypothetical protein
MFLLIKRGNMLYAVIIVCQTFATGNICLFQINDEWETNRVYPVVWVSRPIAGNGNGTKVTFSWNGDLTVACKTITTHSSTEILVKVTDSVFISAEADPKRRDKKSFMLSYRDSQYQFSQEIPDIDDKKTIILNTEWNIPGLSTAAAGLCVDECFICRVDKLSPNLTYRINTETEYGLLFGSYKEGDRLTASDIEKGFRFSLQDFDERNTKTVILQSDNTFKENS